MSSGAVDLRARAAALIDRLADGGRDDEARDALLVELARAQAETVDPYGRLVATRAGSAASIATVQDVPALPTDVFRYARVASFPDEETKLTFLTSGTTHGKRGAHHFRDLSLYDRAARAAAEHALFHSPDTRRLVIVAPHPDDAPESSLSYMLGRFAEWFGEGRTTWAMANGQLDTSAVKRVLTNAAEHEEMVALLGTSFAFVHLDDALGTERFALPGGSFVMQTGGFKGQAREVDPPEMRAMIASRYGVPEGAVVAEYGMTELSSQMYETTLRAPDEPRWLWVPGWVRATPVDPDTLAAVPDGEVGILRIDDVANVDSVCAIQTSDLARRHGARVEMLGRARGAVPRGCGLAMDVALGGERS